MEGGIDVEEAKYADRCLIDAGVDALDFSGGMVGARIDWKSGFSRDRQGPA